MYEKQNIPEKPLKKRKANRNSILFWIFLVIVSAVIVYRIFYFFQVQKNQLTIDAQNNLTAIANLKSAQILDWRNDQLNNADFIFSNRLLTDKIRLYHEQRSGEMKKDISEWFKNFTSKHNYKSIRLFDREGNIIYTEPEFDKKANKYILDNINDVIRNKEVKLSDFHFSEDSSYIHIDLFIPILTNNDPDIKEIITIEIDPNTELYSRIQSWPTASETGECLLVEKYGNGALFLNELRFQKNTALRLKFDSNLENILSVKAIKGDTGIVEGVDYLGLPVIGVITPIKNSPWFLITKLRKEELYSQIDQTRIQTTFLIGLLLVIALSITLYYEKGQKTLYYKSLYESELKASVLERHFGYLVKYANDIILLINKDGKIIEVNDKAVETYGYTLEEFLNLNQSDLMAPGKGQAQVKTINDISPEGSLLFEAVHIKKDGTKFPVEISARKITIDGHLFYQGIIRDITDRKKAEEKIIGLNRVYAVLSQINQAIVWTKSQDELFNRAVEIFIKYGKFKMAWIGLIDEKSHTVMPAAMSGQYEDYLKDINVSVLEVPEGMGPVGKAIREGKYIICNDILNSTEMEPWHEKALKNGFLSVGSFPIKSEDKIVGNINLYSDTIGYFNDEENILFEEVMHDISYALRTFEKERHKLEAIKSLSDSERKFKSVFENANDAIVLFDNGMIIDFNKKTEELFGLSRKKLMFKSLIDFSPEKQNDGILSSKKSDELMKSAFEGNPLDFEWIFNKADGSLLYADISLTSIVLGSKTVLLAILRDNTEKKKSLDIITKARDFYLTLFDEFPAMVWRTGVDAKTNYVNKNWMAYTGKDLEQSLNDEWIEGVHPDDRQRVIDTFGEAFKLRKPFVIEYRLLHSSGIYKWVEDIGNAFYDFDGNFGGYIGACFDISDEKNAQEEMKMAKEKAEELNLLKSSFLANMSHELRTPMTGILGFSEILYSELSDPEFKEMAGMILKGGKRLTNTLNSILDLSRIEADKMDIKLEAINVGNIAKESVAFFEAAAKEKNLELIFDLKDEVFANLDNRIFEQILSNIIQNAITYTLKGSIVVKVIKENTNGSDLAAVKVTDTGIGIPENYLSAIFEPFRQVSSGLGRSYEGTGLGLTITKKFIELMDGTISVESKFGEGSTFTICFPSISEPSVKKEEIKLIEQEAKTIMQNDKKILIVEDDDDNVMAIKIILRNICEIDSIDSGTGAIEMSKTNKYNLILMDIGLKGMNGLEAAQEIKKIPGYEKAPIVAVTAYAMVGDKEKFLQEGCTHYISKPFKAKEFREMVISLI